MVLAERIAVPLVAAAILASQLLVPPVVGLADNGDFGKVAAWFSLAPERPGDEFAHVAPRWVPGPFWDSGFRGTEHLHVAAMKWLGGDLRWQGVTHGVVMIAAITLLAGAIGWRALLAIPLLLDLAYSAYFNSIYMDAAAIVWLSLALAAMISGRWRIACVAAVLFLCAKSAHAIPGTVLIAAALSRRQWAIAGIECAAMLWSMSRMTPEYRAQAIYNVIFTKVAAHATDTDFRRIATGLGVRDEELRWKGTTAFDPAAPTNQLPWLIEFGERIPPARLLGLYASEPWLAFRFIASDLGEEAARIRPVHLGNYARESGREPGAKARGPLSGWSALRSWLIAIAPWHLPVLYAAIASWIVARRMWLTLPALLWTFALAEFAMAALADACETSRHLVLFHWLTDALLLWIAVTLLPGGNRQSIPGRDWRPAR